MQTYKLNDIASVINGQILGKQQIASSKEIRSVSIDSRTIADVASCLFFAIKGERHNGHNYIHELFQKGIRCFVISDENIKVSSFPTASFILVEDSLKALQQLASWVRLQNNYPVLGITGSNGKTIVKEWLFELLQDELKIIRSPKSFNSQVGVPLSVLNMTKQFNMAIFEAGISKVGEMEKLAEIIHPTIGLITNIGDAHQENFVDETEKTDEKLKLFKNCDTIIYCRDQELVHQCLQHKFKDNGKKLFSWTTNGKDADLLIQIEKQERKSLFTFNYLNKKRQLEIPFTDDASIENACHCLAFIIASNLWSDNLENRFSNLQGIAMRLEIKEGINNCTLINDYYNSDINSLEIALQFLKQQSLTSKKKRTLILSDISQSGYPAGELAKMADRLCKLYEVDQLICVGEQLWKHQALFPNNVSFYRSTEEFLRTAKTSDFQNQHILLKGARNFKFEQISSLLQKKYHQTQLQINLNALVENLNRHKALLKPETKIMVMVKAFSYGSGTVEIARALEFQKVDYLAVAVADEGIELRQAGIETPIIVMNPEEHSFEMMLEYRLEPNIYSMEVYQQFDRAARRMATSSFPIHIKLETGMHRLGFSSEKEIEEIATHIPEKGRLRIQSVFSHLAGSDDKSHDEFTQEQYERFNNLCELITKHQPQPVIRHILNSAGIERFPAMQMEMVRLGIGLYGISQSNVIQTETVARWLTVVSQVKEVSAGETIGYSRKGKAEQSKKIAIIPVGYADGYDRRLSNGNGKVWINGETYSVIGNICMDMAMIDVTGSDIQSGDQVELMGEHIRLEQLSEWMGTIPYEVLTGISQRVKRIYIQE